MSPQTRMAARTDSPPQWGLISRIAFRLGVVYFGLFCLLTQILPSLIPISDLDISDLSTLPPMRQIVFWTAARVFRVKQALVYTGSGSGDKTFDWILAFCLLIIAAAATAAWSAADRHRRGYAVLHKWFRIAMRLALAGQMFVYGASKAIPVQMPFPRLETLLQPYGHFSPMGVIWSATGASPAYEMFAGCAEILGGLLLMIPRTAMLGAVVCLADMIQVFTLNMTYDVPVKLFSFHLILLSLFLLAPDLPQLGDVFLRRSAVRPSGEPLLFRSRWANRTAIAAQIVFGLFLLGADLRGAWHSWNTYGGGRPKPALYGIWDVDQMWVDGQLRPPLLTDVDRWRRVIFDSETYLAVERPDDTIAYYGASADSNRKTIAFTKFSDKKWKAVLGFHRDQDRLTLEGPMEGHRIQMQLRLEDSRKFLLATRGFHWIQEYPFNR